jgi:phosphodiesterase/alkaline phosphatase D-like protein
MASLVLGPLLRHAGESDATIWVETDQPCTVEVLGHSERTFCVAGHHYAIVVVRGLEPGVATPYEVTLDGERVWPLEDWPASCIRTTVRDRPMDVVFGSCRVAYPHEPPYTLKKDDDEQGREVDALRAYALRMRERPREQWAGALLLLGDQIYADEVEPATQRFIRGRRDVSIPPHCELAGFHEYTHAYRVSWGDPPIRWLLSTVPSAMIFDDHDVIDDWNTSHHWVQRIRAQGWWDERIEGAFVSYWIYQHLGNLPPEALEADDIYAAVRAADDGEAVLREFAWRADRTVNSTQWSFCRDLGSARLIMVDSRAGRILDPERREMVDEDEWGFIEHHSGTHSHDHILIGTSLPWLLAPGMHHLEAWNEAVCEGAWGSWAARRAEAMREALDLEHWAAFGDSWKRLTKLIERVGAGEDGRPPATIVALSGDVHHAYLAEVRFNHGSQVRSRVYQAVCSPFRNPLDTRERRIIKAVTSRPAAVITRGLARAAGVERPPIDWTLRQNPVFDNVVATLRLDGAEASLRIERARPSDDGHNADLQTAYEARL